MLLGLLAQIAPKLKTCTGPRNDPCNSRNSSKAKQHLP